MDLGTLKISTWAFKIAEKFGVEKASGQRVRRSPYGAGVRLWESLGAASGSAQQPVLWNTVPPPQTGDQGQRGREETQSVGLSAGVAVA